jgi:hypothetical protein
MIILPDVADFLARGYVPRATPITVDVIQAIGLNVMWGDPDKIYESFKALAFTGQPYRHS